MALLVIEPLKGALSACILSLQLYLVRRGITRTSIEVAGNPARDVGGKYQFFNTCAEQYAMERAYGVRYPVLLDLYFDAARMCVIDPIEFMSVCLSLTGNLPSVRSGRLGVCVSLPDRRFAICAV